MFLTRNQVVQYLQNMGFEAYVPRSSSWKFAFIASNKTQTLYFLVGKHGVDFKLYDLVRKSKLDEKGKLYTDGGSFVRNYYKENDENVHRLVIDLAEKFISNTPIDERFLVCRGKSWKEQKVEYIRNHPKRAQKKDEMISIYDTISCGDGGDAYLGDGIWISSSGSLDDLGR